MSSVIDRWRRLPVETRFVLGIAVVFMVLRTALATQSSFGFHQGWNEGHYALIARGFLDHPLVPRYGDTHVYNVPPLFPYVVAAFFAVFGQSTVVARLPSILAGGGTILATYALGCVVYHDRRVAALGSGLLVSLPYFLLYAGRTQTDVFMLCLFTSSLAAIVHGYETDSRRWLAVGGVLFTAAFATKQPAVLLPLIVLAWVVFHRGAGRRVVRQTAIVVAAAAVALVPLATWLVLNYLRAPDAFVRDWQHELLGRTAPFANVPLILLIALVLGVTPLVLALVGVRFVSLVREYDSVTALRRAGQPNVLVLWLLLYGAFVLYRTPHGHQYYVVGLLPPIALLAARGFVSVRSALDRIGRGSVAPLLLAVAVLSSLAGGVVLFELAGTLSLQERGGERLAADAGSYLADNTSENATVLVENGYSRPIAWYARSGLSPDDVRSYRVSSLSGNDIEAVAANSSGPVYVVVPQPTWGPLSVNGSVAYRTSAYELTVMDVVGSYVRTNSKFAYYLDDRRLVVYRVDTPSEPARTA